MRTLILAALLLTSSTAMAYPMQICHRRVNNTTMKHEFILITIDSSYLGVHLRHGDQLPTPSGGCP